MSALILVLSLLGCSQECDPGYGMADGVCYELAVAGGTGGPNGTGAGTGGSGSSDTGIGGSGSGDNGSGSGDNGSGTGGSGTGGSGTGGAGAGDAGTGGSGADGSGTGGGGETSFTVSGTLQVSGGVATGAVCTISMWSASDVDPTTGMPDRSSGSSRDISNQTTSCPPDDAPLAFSMVLNLPAADSVYLYASVDQDGDLLTPEDRAEEGAVSNPFTAELGGAVADVVFTVTAPAQR
jgi:hypothetical protein